jgi:hypothetical protein
MSITPVQNSNPRLIVQLRIGHEDCGPGSQILPIGIGCDPRSLFSGTATDISKSIAKSCNVTY